MRRLSIPLIVALLAGACSTETDSTRADAEQVRWPGQPNDGAPVAVAIAELEGEGERQQAKVDVFNFGEAPVAKFVMDLEYRSASGEVLKTVPHTQQSAIPGKKHRQIDVVVGFFRTPDTKEITLKLREVTLVNGESWAAAS